MYVAIDSCNNTQNVSVSKDHPVYYVEIVGLPLLVFFCTIGNILNIVVIASERPNISAAHIVSKATKVFLLSMAVSDILLMWMQVPSYVADFILHVTYMDKSPSALGFKKFYGVQQWGSAAFMQFSDWVLIAFSIDRLRSFTNFARVFSSTSNLLSLRTSVGDASAGTSTLYSPSRTPTRSPLRATPSGDANSRSFRRRTTVIIVVVLFFGALLFTVEYGTYFFYTQLHPRVDGQARRPQWLNDWNFYQTILDVAVTVAKFAALALINIHLIVILVNQQRRKKHESLRLMGSTSSNNSRRRSKEKTGTRLVVGCLIVYFITHLPFMVVQCLRLASSPPYCLVFVSWDTFQISRPFIKISLFFNYSVNFLLYFALSRKFRDQFNLLPQRVRDWKKRHMQASRWKLAFRKISTHQRRRVGLMNLHMKSSTSSTDTAMSTVYV